MIVEWELALSANEMYAAGYSDDFYGGGEVYDGPIENFGHSTDVPCPRCNGRGMTRWEDDECQSCWGYGTVCADHGKADCEHCHDAKLNWWN